MRIAFLFSLGGYKGLTQNQEKNQNKTPINLQIILAVVD